MPIIHRKEILLDDQQPQILIPVMQRSDKDILQQVQDMAKLDVAGLEWRIDAYDKLFDRFAMVSLLKQIHRIIKDKVFIVTLRTSDEGGNVCISDEEYIRIYQEVIASGVVDMIDIEVQRLQKLSFDMMAYTKHHEVGVILSYHNFYKLPSNEDLQLLLTSMQMYQPTIYKFAIMPQNTDDVYRFYQLAQTFYEQLKQPMIMIAMSSLGMVSRYLAQAFHSCFTFASLYNESAPGQIEVSQLQTLQAILMKLS